MIYTVTLVPAVDRTIVVPGLALNAVNRALQTRVDAGGKGVNVSRWINALGGESIAMGILGGDSGAFIRRALEAEGIRTQFIPAEAETRTNIKLIDTQTGTHTDINEPGSPVDAAILGRVYDRLRGVVTAGDIVVLAGRTPPGTPRALIADWTEALQSLHARVFVDVDGETLAAAIKRGPYLLKPNRQELEAFLGHALDSVRDIADAAHTLMAGGIPYVIVSLGENGALFAGPEGSLHVGGLSVPVGSTVGAGDAMVAALAYGLSEGMAWEAVASLAVAASAAAVMQPGTGVAPLAVVEDLQIKTVTTPVSR